MPSDVEAVTQSYQEWCQQHPGHKLEDVEERDDFFLVRIRRPDGDLDVYCDNRPPEGGRYVRDEMVIDHHLEQDVSGFVAQAIDRMVERCKAEQGA